MNEDQNYIEGKVTKMEQNISLPGDGVFKVMFLEGGGGTFIRCLKYCLAKTREYNLNKKVNDIS